MQYLIGKVLFGVPLDFEEMEVPIWNKTRTELLYTMTEREALHYFYEEGRCNFGNWQDLPARGFNESLIFCGRRGGKAFDVNEEIPTPEGFRKIGDLKEGDSVFGPDGVPVRVVNAWDPFEAETYKVSFDDGTSVVAHGEHQWFTVTKAERKKIRRLPKNASIGSVKTTNEIAATLLITRPDGRRETNHCIKVAEPIQLPAAALPMDPYCLGAWLGDGDKVGGSCYACHIDDAPEILENFKAAGYEVRGYNDIGRHENTRFYVGMTQDLKKIGVIGNKHIPQEYLWASRDQRLALLQGLMDTDGSCCKERARCEFCNTNRDLAEGVYHLAASLGLKPRWVEGRAKLNGKDFGPKYRINWISSLPVFRLKRKLDLLPTAKEVSTRNRWRFIESVEPAGKRTVRCIAVDREDGLFLFGRNFNITHNSQGVSAYGCYKLYKLLCIRSPQEYYSLVGSSQIDFTFLAQDDDGANRVFGKMKNDVNNAPFFSPYIFKSPNTSEMAFVTEADRGKRDIMPSIFVSAWPCTTRAARGPSSIFLVLDEFAHFRNATGANSADVYESAKPATADFTHGTDGDLESLVITITSPDKKVGKSYELWQTALREGANSSIFGIRLSSAEMNPRISSDFLLSELSKTNPQRWNAEYGGEFLEASGSYVQPQDFMACVDTDRGNLEKFTPRAIGQRYFWGLDLGFRKDATALAVGHWELDERDFPRLIVDFVDRLMVGEGKYVGYDELPVDDVYDWLQRRQELTPGFQGVTDQNSGSMFVQRAQQEGLGFFKLINLTAGINSQAAYVLQGFINNKVIRFPNVPKFIREMKLLEAYYVTKYQLKVEAPSEKDEDGNPCHDDMYDAVAEMAWDANKWLLEYGATHLTPESMRFIEAMGKGFHEMPPEAIAAAADANNYALADMRIQQRQYLLGRPGVEAGMQSPRLTARRRR
jgi:hypothetical protein